jgi:type IV pilus assembly protein PilC
MVLAALLFVFVQIAIVGPFTEIFSTFEVVLPFVTRFFLGFVGPATCVLAGWALLLVTAVLVLPGVSGLAGVPRFLYAIPVVGPLWRFSRLARCARLMALLLRQEVPLPDALRLSAAGLPDAYLASGCRRVADEVETGRSLVEGLASKRQFPPSMIPLIDWGERTPALADSFRAAAEMFQGRVQTQGVFLDAVLLPITLLVVVMFVASLAVALLMPLFSLIEQLS